MAEVFIVKHTFPKVVGIVCTLVCCLVAVGAFMSNEVSALAVLVPVAALGIYLILASGRLVIDSEGITHERAFTHHAIRWNEITLVESDTLYNSLVFSGPDKRLVTFGPGSVYWNGKDARRAATFLVDELRRRGIETRLFAKLRFPFNKNVKVKRS